MSYPRSTDIGKGISVAKKPQVPSDTKNQAYQLPAGALFLARENI
jgi:hypothetical protein